MRRRLIAMLPLAIAGCGFALRGTPVFPFERIALAGFDPRSPLLEELTRELAAGAKVVAVGEKPEVVLHALVDHREKGVVASTSSGQVREVQLRVRFEFRLTTPGDRELLSPVALVLVRDLSYAETFALAKEWEEGPLYAAMQTEIVVQVMRRLAQSRKA